MFIEKNKVRATKLIGPPPIPRNAERKPKKIPTRMGARGFLNANDIFL